MRAQLKRMRLRSLTGALLFFAFTGISVAQHGIHPDNWPSFNRNNASDRFSPLRQINKRNVSHLKLLSSFDLGADQANMQTGLVVVDGVMYFTSDTVTYAIDAATADLKWKYIRNNPKTGGMNVNRGVTYHEGKIIRGASDTHVYALDAESGSLLWDVPLDVADVPGNFIAMCPIAWNGLVFIGNAGGDYRGVKGNVYAFDANTGQQVWRFEVIDETTWSTVEGVDIEATGGAFWASFSLDEERGILYVPAGNPAPDFDPTLRPGDNLYSNSIIALNALTGDLLAYNQLVKDDYHDWDVTAAPVVFSTSNGQQMLASANKDGLLKVMDREAVTIHSTGGEERLPIKYELPVTTRVNVDVPLSSETFTFFKPGLVGGSQWNGPAYHPELDMLYVGTIEWGFSVRVFSQEEALANIPPLGGNWWSGEAKSEDPSLAKGWVYAVNAKTGKVKWKYESPAPIWAGVTPTAGGLLFSATAYGDFYAFDAHNGNILWQTNIGAVAGGGLITYAVDGKQYVAVVTGFKPYLPTEVPRTAQVLIFGLE